MEKKYIKCELITDNTIIIPKIYNFHRKWQFYFLIQTFRKPEKTPMTRTKKLYSREINNLFLSKCLRKSITNNKTKY